MKTAREIIARAAWECQRRKLPHFDDHADAILAALAAEGFSIVETGRDPVTIRACAKIASEHRGFNYEDEKGRVCWRLPSKHDIATAIRALSRSTREGKTE